MSFLNIGQKFEKVMGKEPELLEAARTGNLHVVEKLLSSKGRKSQHVGVGGAIGQKLTSFLKSVNVNYTDKNGYTALHHAAVNGHRDIVEVLLKACAQPGLLDNKDCTPVHLAAWNGNAEIVMQLLTAGTDNEDVHPVNVNQQNSTGDTALHCAAQYGHVAVVDVLLQKFANPTIRNLNEESPLDLAAQYGRLEVVQRLLISHPELAHHPSSTQSPLHLASRNGHRDIVEVLLDNKFDIQTMTEMGNALHEAALHGKLDVVKLLLERGIDVNQRDNKGQTVLELLSAHQAQQKSFTVITKAIQEYMRHSGITPEEPGLYESLVNCRSGVDKPTAAVKPLSPQIPRPSERAKSPDKSLPEDLPSDKPPENPPNEDQPTTSERPHPPREATPTNIDKPHPPEEPHPTDQLTMDAHDMQVNLDQSKSSKDKTPDRPTPKPRHSVVPGSPDAGSTIPLYSKPNKDIIDKERVESAISLAADEAPPPPLPPRTSIFPADDKRPPTQLMAEQNLVSTPDKTSPKSLVAPKKPPRQKKSPAPVRKSPPLSPGGDTPNPEPSTPPVIASATINNIPSQETDIPSQQTDIPLKQTDIPITKSEFSDSKSEKSEQHSLQQLDQSDSSIGKMDQSDLSILVSKHHASPPMKSPKPVLPPRPGCPREIKQQDTKLVEDVKKGEYLVMSSMAQSKVATKPVSEVLAQSKVATKPVSEVKPQIKEKTDGERATSLKLLPTQPVMDSYDFLFPNLKKSLPERLQRPELRRTNTEPGPDESEYVKPFPTSPSEKLKEKQGLLRRTNTAPDDSTYLAMKNPMQEIDTKEGDIKPKELIIGEKTGKEITEKEGSLSPSSPKENIYATISDDTGGGEGESTSVYHQIKDVSPPASPTEHEGPKPIAKTGSPKPSHLEFLKMKSATPLTPTGYPQPPTPDFPPPSPATAMLGIELKIQQIDSKRKSRDITTLTDESLDSIQEQRSEVKDTEECEKVKVVGDTEIELHTNDLGELKVTENSTSVEPSSVSPVNKTKDANSSLIFKHSNEVDQSKEVDSVIQTNTKDIPASSIPSSFVIETHSAEMSENRPKVAKKPTVPVRSVKVKSSSPDSKNSSKDSESEVFTEEALIKPAETIENRTSSEALIKPTETKENRTSSEALIKPTETKENRTSSDTLIKPAETEENGTGSWKDSKTETENMVAPAASGDTSDAELRNKPAKSKEKTVEAGAASPVQMRRKTSTSDMDVFKGLLRGSTVGSPAKIRSQFYNEVIRHSQVARNQKPAALKTTMEKEEEIDIDQVMESIDVEVAKRASTADSASFDDSEEWAKIADIMSSFGGNLTTFESPTHSPSEEEFNVAFEAYMDSILSRRDRGSMISVGEWLETCGMDQYENNFVANGYDNIDFLDSKILEEQDLEQIGVLSHDHRQTILKATKTLPLLTPIDPKTPPASVEEWLMSLQLLDYLETFRSHGYDTMEKVQSILWELQLRTVLDISMLGHRKRILASLGERKTTHAEKKKRSISSLSPEERSPFNDINLFKDYTQVKPVSSSEEDIKESSQMAVDSSEDEDVFKKKPSGQSIRNSNIHVRPPHMAQTSSPARQWRHKPEMLIKGCCNYTAQYLGSTVVPELTGGTESTRAGITKLKKSTDGLAKIPIIMLSISYKGVKFIDAKSKKVICDHEIGNIFCACQDTENLKFFAYITRDTETGQHYCHVFIVNSPSLAHDIILTLGESFEVAYQMALKEKSMQEAMELDRKMSQSDAEDSYSTTSKISSNTV